MKASSSSADPKDVPLKFWNEKYLGLYVTEAKEKEEGLKFFAGAKFLWNENFSTRFPFDEWEHVGGREFYAAWRLLYGYLSCRPKLIINTITNSKVSSRARGWVYFIHFIIIRMRIFYSIEGRTSGVARRDEDVRESRRSHFETAAVEKGCLPRLICNNSHLFIF